MKKNILWASLFCAAALLSGCTNNDDFVESAPPVKNQTWTASVQVSKGDIEDILDGVDEGTRAVFVGGNTNRFATLWDQDDVVQAYKDGTLVGTFSLNDEANIQYQGVKDAYLTGTLTGDFTTNDYLDLYLPSKARSYTGQIGTINDMSARFSYQTRRVKVASISGNTITLEKANMQHRQAYLRLILVDGDGKRLHPSQLTITARPNETTPGLIAQSVAADGSIEPTEVMVINTEISNGEYPGELYIAILNNGYDEDNLTQNKVRYRFTAVVDGENYKGASIWNYAPAIGQLTQKVVTMTKQASSTTTTATLGDMDGQQNFGDTNQGATLGDMEGQEDL